MGYKTKNVAITNFSDKDSLVLELYLGPMETFEVVQVTTSFALNDIPRASVVVATGRSMRRLAAENIGTSGDKGYAKIHGVSPAMRQMVEAKIWANPKGEARAGKYGWSKERRLIFRGYYLGMGISYGGGRFQTVLHFIDKSFDLCCSSVASKLINPQSTHSMTLAAVHQNLVDSGASKRKPSLMLETATADLGTIVENDLTEAIKIVLANLAKNNAYEVTSLPGSIPPGQIFGSPGWNGRALEMLRQIEGPAGKHSEAAWEGAGAPGYELGKPLVLGLWKDKKRSALPLPVRESVASYLYGDACRIYESLTFWDVLTNLYCPDFHISVVPLADRLLLVADAPSFFESWDTDTVRGRTIDPEDVVRGQVGSMLNSPLRRVIVFSETAFSSFCRSTVASPAGEYIHDSAESSDGTTLGVGPPPWLMRLGCVTDVASSTGASKQLPGSNGYSLTNVTPVSGGSPTSTPAENSNDARPFFDNWARTIFMGNLLRGRSLVIECRLRFDIAPGSIIKFTMQPEQFIGSVDEQAGVWYGHVMRVITNISCEGPQCSTVYHINFARTAEENNPDKKNRMRACVDQHPLFGPKIYVGAPLVKDMDYRL